MHNLAFFSAVDFEGFDEGWFWREFGYLDRRGPDAEQTFYRSLFEQRLKELKATPP
jgi:hypothetical protein